MVHAKPPAALSVVLDDDSAGVGGTECYEGFGGYFDGTVFEVTAALRLLVLLVERDMQDPLVEVDSYVYTLDPHTSRAEYLCATTVVAEDDGGL